MQTLTAERPPAEGASPGRHEDSLHPAEGSRRLAGAKQSTEYREALLAGLPGRALVEEPEAAGRFTRRLRLLEGAAQVLWWYMYRRPVGLRDPEGISAAEERRGGRLHHHLFHHVKAVASALPAGQRWQSMVRGSKGRESSCQRAGAEMDLRESLSAPHRPATQPIDCLHYFLTLRPSIPRPPAHPQFPASLQASSSSSGAIPSQAQLIVTNR